MGRRTRVVILGAGGRDFHNFNVLYRDNPAVEVVAFTATQIPGIAGRTYPTAMAGYLYPAGIPIVAEAELERICEDQNVAQVVFAYSDVPHAHVMHLASRCQALGADFVLHGPDRTMLTAQHPVVAISAVRTGCGKSQTARWLSRWLRGRGLQVAVLRHPMPYGDLEKQDVQRFANHADLTNADCTIEEREEYEPHIAAGSIVYAGVDYGLVLKEAERQTDIILWDGGNNDIPFIHPLVHVVLIDALRPGMETAFYPGETALRMADIVVISKVRQALRQDIDEIRQSVGRVRPDVPIVEAASPVALEDPADVRNQRVLIVEDGPTITHGGMAHGAGYAAAGSAGASEIVDPRASAPPGIAAVYQRYPHIGPVLPAVGYSAEQRRELAQTINESKADIVIAATPVDLASLLKLSKPVVRAHYQYADASTPTLTELVETRLRQAGALPA